MLHFTHLIPVIVYLFIAPQLSAQEEVMNFAQQEAALLNNLAAINRYSPLEGAYSHGSIGATLGLGIQNHAEIKTNTLQHHHLYIDQSQPAQKLSTKKMYFIKGSTLPVDFGFSLGSTQDDQISMAGAHAQWSVFEGFRMPALALRGSYNKLFGLKDAEMQSTRVDVIASTSMFSFFSAYIASGAQRNVVMLNSAAYFQYGLVTQPENQDYQKTWWSRSHAIGLRALLIPPVLGATLELQLDEAAGRSIAGKISLDI